MKFFVLAPEAKLARRVDDGVAARHGGVDCVGIAHVAKGQLYTAPTQETEVARRADERTHTMSTLDEQRDEVVSQEAGRARDKDQSPISNL
jgi:hypothetical protein